MNIHEYFKMKLGRIPSDHSLKDLPVDSGCGQDCKRIIDEYAKLKGMVDPHPRCVGPLIQSASACVEIYWRG